MKREASHSLGYCSYLLIVVIIATTLSACGTSVYILELTTGAGTSVKTARTETIKGKQIGTKCELTYNELSNGLGAYIQIRPVFQTETRKIGTKGCKVIWPTMAGILGSGLAVAAIGNTYEERDASGKTIPGEFKPDTPSSMKAMFYVFLCDGLVTGILPWILSRDVANAEFPEWTAKTPWKPGLLPTVGIGKVLKVPNQPVLVSLPEYHWQQSYLTDSEGLVRVKFSDLANAVSNLANLTDLKLLSKANSIDVVLSTPNPTDDTTIPDELEVLLELKEKKLEESLTLFTDDELQAFRDAARQQLKFRQEAPADLTTQIVFSDEEAILPNQTLDAGEQKGKLVITIRNGSEGIGFDVRLQIHSDNPNIQLATTKSLGDIAPNEEKTVTVPIGVTLKAQDGVVNLLVETKEKRGFDAQKQQIRIPVVHLAEPKLELTSVELNDKQLGNAMGNGNGIPENNETIELIALIRNSGVGDAIGVRLDLDSITSEIQVLEDSTELGRIRPNQTVRGKLLFHIPRTFRSEQLDYTIRVSDVRGADTREKTDTVGMGVQQPVLTYQIKPFDTLQNGRKTEFEFIPKNNGKLLARNVRLTFSAPGVTITPSSIEIGELKSDSTGLPQPFSVTLPRTYAKKDLPLEIKMTQSDFASLTKTETYPVESIKPDLVITDKYFDANGNGNIEQGERVELELTLINRGKLEALDTVLNISTADQMVRLSASQKRVGRLPPNATSDPVKFTITVPRAVKAAALPITVEVTHADFPKVERTLNYTVYETGISTTVVKPTEPEKESPPPALRGNQLPVILPNIADNQTVYASSYLLKVSVSDDRGLSSIQVKLNGKKVYDSQTDLSAADKLQASSGKLLSFSQSLALQAGSNEVLISALDNDNERGYVNLIVIYNPSAKVITGISEPSDVDVEIPQGKGSNPNSVALVIGIEKYQNVSDANYANRDAIAFRQYLVELLGFSEDNIIFLTDERATQGGLKMGLRKLENLIKPNQTEAVVFYSGHGAPTLDGKQQFIIPYDGEPNYPEDTGYPLQSLYERLSKMQAKSVTVILDACFSGLDRENNLIIKEAKPIFLTVSGPLAYENLTVFASSTGTQISSSLKEKKHGLFTYYLLKGMRGEADADNNQSITLAELDDFVSKNVSAQALRMNRPQTPMLTGKEKERVFLRY